MAWPTKTDFVDGDVLNASQMNNIGTNLNLADPTGITDGYVLTANGAGSMGWEPVAADSMTLIETGTLSGTSKTTGTIPGTYKDLVVWSYGVTVSTATQYGIRLNSLTADYDYNLTENVNGTAYNWASNSAANGFYCATQLKTTGGNNFFKSEIPMYATSRRKLIVQDYFFENTDNQRVVGHGAVAYIGGNITVTTITFYSGGATFNAGTYFVYGVK